MVYDSLYPFGDRRLGLEIAHLARATAFGAISEPSGRLNDYLLFDTPTLPTVADTADAIKEEQMAVIDTLDLIFGVD